MELLQKIEDWIRDVVKKEIINSGGGTVDDEHIREIAREEADEAISNSDIEVEAHIR